MQELKYFVLWKKDSPLLQEYLEKYYHKLISDLGEIWEKIDMSEKIKILINNDNLKRFLLNGDISSLIQSIKLDDNIQSIGSLITEIDIFLTEWTDSPNLTQNKWTKILGTTIRLTDYDNNPYNKDEAHPNHIDSWAVSWNWWEKKASEWIDVYNNTFKLLKLCDEWIYDELNQIITKIIPLWTEKNMHNSCSYKECIWHIYLGYTLGTDIPEINNLEAIIHESSHNKLNLLLQFDPLVLNNKQEKYYSAIRPDARHIHGVFLGYHAFAPTIYIIMKAYKQWLLWDNSAWLEKITLYYIKVKFLQKVIKKYAKLTNLWIEISCEIDYVINQMSILFNTLKVDISIIQNAKKQQIIHFNEVNKKYPYLEY